MNYILEISICVIAALYILFELVRINLFKKDDRALLAGAISLLSLGFSLYLWIKGGLILDYGPPDEIIQSRALFMFIIAVGGILISLAFLLTSLVKFILWKVKKA